MEVDRCGVVDLRCLWDREDLEDLLFELDIRCVYARDGCDDRKRDRVELETVVDRESIFNSDCTVVVLAPQQLYAAIC